MVDLKSLLFATPEKRVENIHAYLQERKFDRARQLVQNGLKDDPNYLPYHLAHFQLEALEGKIQEGRAAAERIHKMGAQALQELVLRFEGIKSGIKAAFEYWDALAGCELRKKDFNAASEYLEHIEDSDAGTLLRRYQIQCEKLKKGPAEQLPPNAVHFYKVGLLGEKLGKIQEAAEAYAFIAKAAPADAAMLSGYLEKRAAAMGVKGQPFRLAAARIWADAGRWQEAANAYIAIVRTDSSAAPAVAAEAARLAQENPEVPLLNAVLYHAYLVQKKMPEAFGALEQYASDGQSAVMAIKWLEALRESLRGEPHLYLTLGKLYLDCGDGEQAARALTEARACGADPGRLAPLLEKLLAAAPKNVQAHEALGDLCFETKKFEEAARHYRQVARMEGKRFTLMGKAVAMLEMDPSSAEGLLLLAELAKAEGQPGRMGVALRALLRSAPERAAEALDIASPPGSHPQAYLAAAESAALAGQHQKAFQHLAGFLTTYKQEARRAVLPFLLLAGKEKKAVPKLTDLLQPLAASDPALMFALGEAARLSGQPEAAFGWYRQALAAQPDKAPQIQEAMEVLIHDFPKQQSLRFELAGIYFQMGHFAQVREQMERLVQEAPQEMPRIMEQYRLLREKCPQDLSIGVGAMRAQLSARSPKSVIQTATDILPLAKNSPEVLSEIQLTLGQAFLMSGDAAKATARFVSAAEQSSKFLPQARQGLESVLEREPAHVEALLGLARVHAMESEHAKGLECLRRLFEADSARAEDIIKILDERFAGVPSAAVLAARIHFAGGDGEEAAAAFDRLGQGDAEALEEARKWLADERKRKPADALLAAMQGQALAYLGRTDEAIREIRRAAGASAAVLPRAQKTAEFLVKNRPGELEPILLRAHLALRRGAFREAVEAFAALPSCPEGKKAMLEAEMEDAAVSVEHDGALLAVLAHEGFRLGLDDIALRLTGRALGHEGAPLAPLEGDLAKLIQSRPGEASLYLEQAMLHMALAKWPEALAGVLKAVEMDPGEREAALDLLEQMRRSSGMPEAAVAEADAAMALGQWKRVLDIFEETDMKRAEAGLRAEMHLRRGMALMNLGRSEEANRAYAEAYRHAPDEAAMLARVAAFEENAVRERFRTLESAGTLAPFSAEEREALRLHADSRTLSLVERGGDALRGVRSLCRAWLGNTAWALTLSEADRNSARGAHLAMLNRRWDRAMAHLQNLNESGASRSFQPILERAAAELVREALSGRPRALMGVSAFRRNQA